MAGEHIINQTRTPNTELLLHDKKCPVEAKCLAGFGAAG